jgi:hypothetical protein
MYCISRLGLKEIDTELGLGCLTLTKIAAAKTEANLGEMIAPPECSW